MARDKLHQAGKGARLLAVLLREGIGFRIVRTWPGDKKLERAMKKRRCAPQYCPVCRANRRSEAMTNQQARVLALIRQEGQIRANRLTSMQSRSLESLRKDGHIRYLTCGTCDGCKAKCECYTLTIQATAPIKRKDPAS